jgi:hypothetical protein
MAVNLEKFVPIETAGYSACFTRILCSPSYFSGTEVVYVSIPGHPELELLSTTLGMVIGTVIPFVIIAISNLIIIITVKSASKAREKLSGKKAEGSKNAHMTRMLIFVSVAYAITSLPYRLYYFISDIPEISRYVTSVSSVLFHLGYSRDLSAL